MCTNSKYIYNRYINRSVLVSCGKCPACLQSKAAARANRIRNHVNDTDVCLFVTLTYANRFIPYIYKDDVNDDIVNVYRHSSVRWYGDHPVIRDKRELLGTLDLTFDDDSFYHRSDDFKKAFDRRKGIKCMKHTNDRFSVCWFADGQNFMKRLRINLERKYGIKSENQRLSYYMCTEYGSKSQRAHLHLALFCPKSLESTVRSAICESWLYGDSRRTSRFIQVARDVASYVASYVNRPATFPRFLEKRGICQKHSFSQGFGVRAQCFSLPSLLEKIERRDLHYYRESFKNGVRTVSSVLIPKYVINRFFPLFKGYNLLNDFEIHEYLRNPSKLCGIVNGRFRRCVRGVDFSHLHENHQFHDMSLYSHDDFHRWKVRIENAYERFKSLSGLFDCTWDIYSLLYTSVWNLYHSSALIDSFENVTCINDLSDHYENILDLESGNVHSDLAFFLSFVHFQCDPNKRHDVVESSLNLTSLYHKYQKHKYINDEVIFSSLSV